MPPRLHVDLPLAPDSLASLPEGAARHVRVLRLQPGAALVLFDGRGGEWAGRVGTIGRAEVTVEIGAHDPVERELPAPVTLALGMPANDRMDFVIEKATELGAAVIQPLVCERSVLRLEGERATKKVAHWQAVAIAAAEQSGRTRVPRIEPVRAATNWLATLARPPAAGARRWLLAFEDARSPAAADARAAAAPADDPTGRPGEGAPAVAHAGPASGSRAGRTERPSEVLAGSVPPPSSWCTLSGPEGGLTRDEEAAARAAGFSAVSLGPRVLRADTAPLALLAWIALRTPG